MFQVELLYAAMAVAERLGYEVRHENLGGHGGGVCELKGKKLLIIDLAQGPMEQLDLVLAAVRSDPRTAELALPQGLRAVLFSGDCSE